MEGDEIQKLLREIRDTQREHLAEYRQVTQRSLELQQRAVARQEQIGRFTQSVRIAARRGAGGVRPCELPRCRRLGCRRGFHRAARRAIATCNRGC